MRGISIFVLLLISCATEGPPSDRAVLDSRERQYQQCYLESDSFMQRHQVKKTGQVTIQFIVTQEGKVAEEKITMSDFKDANFHACLLEMTRSLSFSSADPSLTRNMKKY